VGDRECIGVQEPISAQRFSDRRYTDTWTTDLHALFISVEEYVPILILGEARYFLLAAC
jgi:hypothetical protein